MTRLLTQGQVEALARKCETDARMLGAVQKWLLAKAEVAEEEGPEALPFEDNELRIAISEWNDAARIVPDLLFSLRRAA